jgi:uncharacterized protein YciI
MRHLSLAALAIGLALAPSTAVAQSTTASPYDSALAQSLGADERGMRSFVLCILKTGPTPVPAGPARDEMFRGHFANMARLAAAGKLAVAGPFDGAGGWRGMYIFAVKDVEEARALVATDPVVMKGEMVPELHPLYSSAALMTINATHARIAKQAP